VSNPDPVGQTAAVALLDLYDSALPEVYGYLRPRCGSTAVAEDLTSETFLAAVDSVKRQVVAEPTTAWLIGVARHKLVDHWRRLGREERKLTAVANEPPPDVDDPWDAHLDAVRAHAVLAGLGPHHRAALTLRYLDGLPVPEVADHLGRTVHATEALLVRARKAFRTAYDPPGSPAAPTDTRGGDDRG
jgi:RNA polymerase sigma-70 factor (ECF subfamily)